MAKHYKQTRFDKLVQLDSEYSGENINSDNSDNNDDIDGTMEVDELLGYSDKIGKDILEYLEEFPNKSSKIQNLLNHWAATKILPNINRLNVDISKKTYSKLIYAEHKSKFNITKFMWNNKYSNKYLDANMLQYLNGTGLCDLKGDKDIAEGRETLLHKICCDSSPHDYAVNSYELIKYLIDIGSDINGPLAYYLEREYVEMRIVRLFFRKTNPIPLEYNSHYLNYKKSDSNNRKEITKYILRKHIKMIEESQK